MRRCLLLLGLLWMVLSVILAAVELGREPEMVIRWATETEVDTLGFNVYRATAPEGPFQQINPLLIAGSVDPLAGAEYEYVDSTVEAGQDYFYQLQEVETDGTLNRLELAAGTALGARRWVLLLSASGATVGGLLIISGLRRSVQQGAVAPVADPNHREKTGERYG